MGPKEFKGLMNYLTRPSDDKKRQKGYFETNDPKEAAREVIRRVVPIDQYTFPITNSLNLGLGPNLNQTNIGGEFDVGGGTLSVGGGMKGDDKAFGIGFRKEFDDGGRIGFLKAGLVKGGSRTAPEFRGKYGVRTALTVPETTPGYLGRSGEQVIFDTKNNAERFIKEDAANLTQAAQENKKRSPVIEARLQKIKDFVKAEKKAGKKKIYLDDIIDQLAGEKTVFGTGKRGIQTEQTELKSRVSLRDNVREALGEKEYDKLIKSQAADPRITDEKKAKFNKLVLDVNRGDLPIISLGSAERGTTQNIKLYLTEANKKRFDKMLPSLRAINSRVTQPAETLTKEGIEELKKTTTKNFGAMMKKYPSSIEKRTQVFKGGTRFYDAKSFALAQIGRHVTQGGTLYKHVGGDTMKDVKFRNTKTNKLITIRNMDMNSPEFKEAGETYKDFEKLKNTQIDNPLDSNKKISINESIRQGSDGKDYLVVDHVDGIKNNPLKNLIITNQKQNLGFQLANLTDDQKKLFYRNRLSLDDNIKRFTNYGQRLLGGSRYRTPKQTVADLVAKGEITTADKAPEPEATKTRKLFEGFGERIKSGASDLKSKMDSSKFLTSKIPGGAAVMAPIDLSMMLLSGAPIADAAASAGSYFLKDPYLGRAVNIPLALREATNYGDANEMLRRATERREGIESAIQNIPERFKNFINQNRDDNKTIDPFMAAKGGRASFESGTIPGGYTDDAYKYLREMDDEIFNSYKKYRAGGGKMKYGPFAYNAKRMMFGAFGVGQKKFAEGGGVKSGPPPESGPTPHGLPSLMKRGMKI